MSSILQRIEDLPKNDSLYEEDEVRPSADAIEKAKDIISHNLKLLISFNLTEPDIHPFDGSIRIIWQSGNKTLKLITPPNGSPYVYRQTGEKPGIVRQGLPPNDFKDSLYWVVAQF